MSDFTKDVKRLLLEAGCTFLRQVRGDHEIWKSPLVDRPFTVDGAIKSRHTANGTLKDAGLPKAF